MKYFLITLAILTTTSAFAQKAELYPKEHSNKWKNGREWAIAESNGVEVKLIYNKEKSKRYLFEFEIRNNSDADVIIDPEHIFYQTVAFDTLAMRDDFDDNRYPESKVDEIWARSFKEKTEARDTTWIEKPDKLIKNMKFLSGLGFLFDSDNLAITRAYDKIDYYRENLLLKNTVEPNNSLTRLLIIHQTNYAEEIELHVPMNGEDFVFPFFVREE